MVSHPLPPPTTIRCQNTLLGGFRNHHSPEPLQTTPVPGRGNVPHVPRNMDGTMAQNILVAVNPPAKSLTFLGFC